MCEFCKFNKKIDGFGSPNLEIEQRNAPVGTYFQMEELGKNDHSLYVFIGDENNPDTSHVWYSTQVKYCPWCGRKL